MRVLVLLVPVLVASIASAAGDASAGYDDRVMTDRVTKAMASVRGLWQDPDKAAAGVRKALAYHLKELGAVVRELDVVLRSRDAPRDIVTHRRAIKAGIETFLARVNVYGRICHLHASARQKLKALKRAEPPKPS